MPVAAGLRGGPGIRGRGQSVEVSGGRPLGLTACAECSSGKVDARFMGTTQLPGLAIRADARGYGVSGTATIAVAAPRWAPTWLGHTPSRAGPRCSRQTARMAAPARRTW